MVADRPEDRAMMEVALREARASLDAGGVPVGAALAEGDRLVASGHNERVQLGDPIAHGEIACLRNAGRQRSYRGMTIYTTLSPCPMCTGAIWPATEWTSCCSTMSAARPLCGNSRNATRRSGARTSAGVRPARVNCGRRASVSGYGWVSLPAPAAAQKGADPSSEPRAPK